MIIEKTTVNMVIIAIAMLFFPMSAGAHPADGGKAIEVHQDYGTEFYGMGAEFNINDLYFVKPLPDPATLSEIEKYMLRGLSEDNPGGAMRAWYMVICETVSAYRQRTGTMPTEYSAEIIQALLPEGQEVGEEELAVFRSPITGEFPKLNATEFSAGDLYIRPLTEDEKQYIANVDNTYQQMWYEGLQYEPIAEAYNNIMMITDVYYVRVYGYNDVIHTGLYFLYTRT
jgi:hypothetical protein